MTIQYDCQLIEEILKTNTKVVLQHLGGSGKHHSRQTLQRTLS